MSTQLTVAELTAMRESGDFAGINQARSEGRLNDILSGKAEGTGDYATRMGKSRVSEPINNRDFVPEKRTERDKRVAGSY